MTRLYDPARHEPLTDRAWDPDAARRAIVEIVADTQAAAAPASLWPNHPDDLPDGAPPQGSLYMGAAGVIWALDHLAREGAAEGGPDRREALAASLVANRTFLAGLGAAPHTYLLGDAGVLWVQWKLGRAPETLEALAGAIAGNTDAPALELMWGAPGTMLAAAALRAATGEDRWRDLFRDGARALEAAFLVDSRLEARLWTQTLYGAQPKLFGAVHGFAGNAAVLIAGRDLLEAEDWGRWAPWLTRTLAATATPGEGGVNWLPGIDTSWYEGMIVQHCHGAPGMVNGFAGLAEADTALLLDAGALIWAAGPLTKGAGLCHGTAGNGLAFLKLFARTGDQLWLDRARAFAMHAIGQSDAREAQVGRRRYTLWTGDPGLACYLWECLRGTARFPTVDVL